MIRFWHSLFSLYRVLQIPGQLKIETILDPYKGSDTILESLKISAKKWP